MEHPSRRALLAAAAGTALTATLGRLTAAHRAPDHPAPPPPRKAKKAVKYGMIAAGHTLAEKFALLARCGFDGVELDSPGDWRLADVQQAMRDTGLVVPGVGASVHSGKTLSSPDAAVREACRTVVEPAGRDAKALGCSSVLVVPAVVSKEVPYMDAWRRSHDEIAQLVPLAQELQVEILIENVWNGFLLGPTELVRYVDEFESKMVGVHFDPGNLVRFCFPEHWVPVLGARIRKVDVKDFDRKKNSFDVLLNDGDTDWPAL